VRPPFISVAAASAFNAFCWMTDFSGPPTAHDWWLLIAMTVGYGPGVERGA